MLVRVLGQSSSSHAGFADTEVAHLAALGLEEARRTAVERLGQALLACGRAGEVIPVLEPVRYLRTDAGKVSLTLYDRAGTGLSPGPVADYGMEASVEGLAEVVRAVGHRCHCWP